MKDLFHVYLDYEEISAVEARRELAAAVRRHFRSYSRARPGPRVQRNFRNTNYELAKMCQHFSRADWPELYQLRDVGLVLASIHRVLHQSV